jgi:hypothetical protein
MTVSGAGNISARRDDTSCGYNVGNLVCKEEGDHRKYFPKPAVHSLLCGEVLIGAGINYQPECEEGGAGKGRQY